LGEDVLKSLCNIVIFGGSKQTWLNAWVPARPGGGDDDGGGGGGKGEWAAKWRMKDGDYALGNFQTARNAVVRLLQCAAAVDGSAIVHVCGVGTCLFHNYPAFLVRAYLWALGMFFFWGLRCCPPP
jgi:hypothetical protein